jgi:hypothetical protein
MTTIAHQTVVGENGEPAAALIPWSVFVELQELLSEQLPNATTQAAMNEITEGLPRFGSVEDLIADLNS